MNAREARRRRATDELIDGVALAEFNSHHGESCVAPVAIVIAAYKEADNIERVVKAMPAEINGAATSVVVVVDGEDDGTGAIARAAGALAVIAPVNRGQGAALRLGYRVAREQGAQYIVTADGDGQTDPEDLGRALEPVMSGTKDFVNGSRRLGTTHGEDSVRNAGVVVFATLISLLTGQKVTDTANPVRAFRADLTASLILEEPQYQASELLISALSQDLRYGEVPVTMLTRMAGKSKKGGNLSYGYRYARVLVRTYWREQINRRDRARASNPDPSER
ncbi:MAG: glycosyltransferase family 2 protein [Acidimicrobiales bacterium]